MPGPPVPSSSGQADGGKRVPVEPGGVAVGDHADLFGRQVAEGLARLKLTEPSRL